MSGAGSQGAGGTNGGSGVPEEAPAQTGRMFQDRLSGDVYDGRRIDAHTRRYVHNEHGRIEGMRRAHQIILLACLTDEGSSAVVEMGNRLKRIQKLDQGTAKQLNDVYRLALAKHTSIIELRGVSARRFGTNGAFVRVDFKDLTTGEIDAVDVRTP